MAKPVLNAPDNGIPHRGFSGQLYGKLPDLTTALQIASEYEFVNSQATGGAAAEWLAGFANEMMDPTQHVTVSGITYTGKAALIISVYDKGVVWDGATLPTYMQATPAFQMQAGPLMQPTRVGSPAVSGYTEWGAYHANIRTKPRLDGANALYATTPYRAVWEDTMGPDTLHGQQWWAGSGHTAGTAISPADWVTQEKSVLTKIATAVGANVYVACNGVRPQAAQAAGGGAFFHLIDVADMSMWENWGNAGGSIGSWCSITTASTARPTDTQWQAMCQAALDVQLAGKDFHGLVTFAATSVSAGGPALRSAQEMLVATQLLASNGSAGGHILLEIALGGTAQTGPWTNGELTNPLYDSFASGGSSVLGNPSDHYTAITSAIVATSASGALYQRAYANGYVLYNSGTTSLTSPLDGRTYTDLFTGATVGSSVVVPGGTARILHTTGGGGSSDTTPPTITITTPATATITAPPGATTQTIAGTISDDVLVDHVDVQNQTTGVTITDTSLNASGGGGGGTGSAQTTCYWGAALTENLDANFWTHLHAVESSADLNRLFASIRKNYGPDNTPIISAAMQQAWQEGRYFQYQNGKPGPKAPDTGTSGTFWRSVANGNYDSIYIAFFEAVRTAGMWTNGNPLNYSFHHEQYVTSEGGGADYGTAADYIAFHRHLYNLLVNGGGGHGPWHVKAGGNIRVSFCPHWRQFYEDATYGTAAATGGVVGYTFSDLNPGAAYYEIIGADIYSYNGDNWTAAQQWTPVQKAAKAMGKPIVTGETGVAADNGDAYAVNYLKALDALLKGWGAGWGAGQILGINWTNRIVNTPGKTTTSDLTLDATPAIMAQYKAMAHDPFYSAVATPTNDGSKSVGPPTGSGGTFSVDIPIDPTVAGGSNAIKVIGYDSSGNPSTAKFRTVIAQGGSSSDKAPPVITLQAPAEPLPKQPVRGISFANPPSAALPAGYPVSAIPALTCYLNWSDLQTAQGAPISGAGLTKLNAYIAWARSVGGVVKIRLFCNGSWVAGARDSGAPDWLKTSVGTFRHLNSQDQNPSTDPALVLARYWRPGAVTAYEGLISQLAALVDGEPVIRDVSVSGAMMLYAEPFILDLADQQNRAELVGGGTGWAASGAAGIGGSTVAVPGAGYTNAAHMSAIQQMIDIHAKYLLNTDSSVAYNPYQVLLSQSEAAAAGKTNTYTGGDQYFTSTDEAGIPNTKAMIDYAVSSLGDRAILENHSARPDYFNYDASGNASSIITGTPYGDMYAYMVGKNGPLFIQTANSTQITNTTYPDVGVAFAKTMDAVINLLFAAGVEPPTDFQTLAAGHSQFSAAQFTSYTAALQANPISRGRTTNASASIPSSQTTYTIQVQVEDPDTGVASVTIDGVVVTPSAPNVYTHQVTVPSGTHSYQIVAKDGAGNQSTATATVTRAATLVDYLPPVLTVTLRNAAGTDIADDVVYATGTTTVTVRGTAADEAGGSGLAGVTINGTAVAVAADGTFSKAVTVSAGSNPIKVIATDKAGNSRTLTRTASVTTHTPPRIIMTNPTSDGTVAQSQTSELVQGSVKLGDGSLTSVKVNGVTVASGGAGNYHTRAGADYGGGYVVRCCIDDRTDGKGFAGGDVWGLGFMSDWGIFEPRNLGINVKTSGGNNSPYLRAATPASIKHPGRYYIGTGGLNAGLAAGYFGYVTDSITAPIHVSGATQYGFGTLNVSAAARPRGNTGRLIRVDYIGPGDGSGTEYIYALMNKTGSTSTFLCRSTDGGETWTELWSGVVNAMGAMKALCLLDTNNDGVKDAVLFSSYRTANESGSQTWLLKPAGAATLQNATGPSQVTVTTVAAAPGIVEDINDCSQNHDGSNIMAACGASGLYTINRAGTTWTAHGSNSQLPAGKHLSSVDGYDSSHLIVGAAGVTAASVGSSVYVMNGGTTWVDVTDTVITHGTTGGRICSVPWGQTAEWWLLSSASLAAASFTNYPGNNMDIQDVHWSRTDHNTLMIGGSSAVWVSRNLGVNWRPMTGLNGGITHTLLAGTGGNAQNDNQDYAKAGSTLQTTDHYNTIVRTKNPWPAWPAQGPRTLTDSKGNKFNFTGGNPPDVTRTPAAGGAAVSVLDDLGRASLVSLEAWDISSDDVLYIAQFGGAIVVLEQGGTSFSTTMALSSGANALSVVVTDSNGLTTEFDATIIRPPAIVDNIAPSVAWNAPVDPVALTASVPNSQTSLSISGTTTDDSGTVSSFTIGGASVALGAGGAWTKNLTGLAVGANTFPVVATDPTGNTYSATLTINRAAVGATPSVLITTPDGSVASGVTSVAIAGVAAAPGGTIASVAAWANSDVSHVTASLGATVPPNCLAGVRLGDQSAAAGQQTYPGGLDAFQALVGAKFGLNSYGDVWDFGTAEVTQMQTDIAAGRAVYFEWAPPAATALSPSDQIVNGSQDAIITAKINMLKPLGGTIILRIMQGFTDGSLGIQAKNAMTYIIGKFRAASVTNVKFVYCTDHLDASGGFPYYPGPGWFDYVGFEAYNTVAAGYVSPQNLYSDLLSLAAMASLPAMICQSGSEEFSVSTGPGSKAQWILDLGAFIKNNLVIDLWAYRSSVFQGLDLRLDSSPDSLAAYQTVIQDVEFNPGRSWTATVPNLQVGANTIQAQTTDSNGNVSPRDSITITRANPGGVPVPQPPSPQLSDTSAAGRYVVGDTVHVTAGGFTNGPITNYQFRWYRGTTGTPFRTTTGVLSTDNYTLASADVGQPIRVDVIATNASGPSVPVSTASSPAVRAVPGVPTIQTAVTVSDIG